MFRKSKQSLTCEQKFSDPLSKAQMAIFNGEDHHWAGCKIKYFLCNDDNIWKTLIEGKGAYWQQQLLINDEFKIENSQFVSPHGNRTEKIYKSGHLLYYYGGYGKGSYGADVFVIQSEDKGVQLKKFLSIHCERYSLPDKAQILPFNPLEDNGGATCVSSTIDKYSEKLLQITPHISSLIWDVSMGKNLDINALAQHIENFNNELKYATTLFLKRAGYPKQTLKNMIEFDDKVLRQALPFLTEIKTTPAKQVIFANQFFACGYNPPLRTEISYLISSFLQKHQTFSDLHVFESKDLTSPTLTIAATHYFEHILDAAKKLNVIYYGTYATDQSDGYPTKCRADFSSFETSEDIAKFRQFLDYLSQELSLEVDVKKSMGKKN
jgi:hypothetical protein